MTAGWSFYVVILVISNIAAAGWLLFWQRKKRVEKGQTLGHEFDGIQEFDNPLPRWWLGIFVGTIAWSVFYLLLYPGLGSFGGLLGWTQTGQYDAEVAEAKAEFGPLYAGLAAKPVAELVTDETAQRIGGRIFANNCAQCHGADGRGGLGFPNLTDSDWLYGGDAEVIKTSILYGRAGLMPPFAEAIGGEAGVPEVVAYIRHLGGFETDETRRAAGQQRYMQVCIACHGPDGKGNQALGSPNLTDDVWLYGSSEEAITEGLWKGRNGVMPAHGKLLGEERVHIVAAYVYGLSQE